MMIVLKIIGWVLLGILGLVLTVVIAALCHRVSIFVEYSHEATFAYFKYLFIKKTIYDSRAGSPEEDSGEKTNGDKTDGEDTDEDKEESDKIDKEEDEKDKDEESGSENTEDTEEKKDADGKEGNDKGKSKSGKKKKGGLLKDLYNCNGIDGVILLLKRLCSYLKSFIGDLISAFVVEEFYLDICCHKNDAAETALFYGEVSSAVFPLIGSLASKIKLRRYDINVFPDYLARHSDANFYLKMHLTPGYLVWIILVLVFRVVFKALFKPLMKVFVSGKKKSDTKPDKKITEEKSEKTDEQSVSIGNSVNND